MPSILMKCGLLISFAEIYIFVLHEDNDEKENIPIFYYLVLKRNKGKGNSYQSHKRVPEMMLQPIITNTEKINFYQNKPFDPSIKTKLFEVYQKRVAKFIFIIIFIYQF